MPEALNGKSKIVEEGHQQALAILNQNRDLLETIAQQILETEVIEGEQLQNLLNQVKPSEKPVDKVAAAL